MPDWTMDEKHVLAATAAVAPSVHNTRPWVLALPAGGHVAELWERMDRALPRHDPRGRDRLGPRYRGALPRAPHRRR